MEEQDLHVLFGLPVSERERLPFPVRQSAVSQHITNTPDLYVQSPLPAVNAGYNLGSSVVGTLNLAGTPRMQGATIDLGAYEQ